MKFETIQDTKRLLTSCMMVVTVARKEVEVVFKQILKDVMEAKESKKTNPEISYQAMVRALKGFYDLEDRCNIVSNANILFSLKSKTFDFYHEVPDSPMDFGMSKMLLGFNREANQAVIESHKLLDEVTETLQQELE